MVSITAQLYSASPYSYEYYPVPNAILTIATYNSLANGSGLDNVISGLSIPVTAMTRLALVYSITVTNLSSTSYTMTGTASGGINIQ